MKSVKEPFTKYITQLQNKICETLEEIDGKARFKEDSWDRKGGGGGKTRVIEKGNIFEKGGVNTSTVFGKLPETLKKKLMVEHGDFFASGISLVIHPLSPMIPTVHANFRYFELYKNQKLKDQWFGGGADLTPYYLFEEDPVHFHRTFKNVCDKFSPEFYTEFKKACDVYFFNSHRDEARGIGGIFFDYLRPSEQNSIDYWHKFVSATGDVFLDSYIPIVMRRKHENYNEQHIYWQEIRRGRYVEFNLIHDRGTLFGLKTQGRTESILMSLPPRARWDYNYQVETGSKEDQLLKALKPKNWIETTKS